MTTGNEVSMYLERKQREELKKDIETIRSNLNFNLCMIGRLDKKELKGLSNAIKSYWEILWESRK